jgi:hypothetical protein
LTRSDPAVGQARRARLPHASGRRAPDRSGARTLRLLEPRPAERRARRTSPARLQSARVPSGPPVGATGARPRVRERARGSARPARKASCRARGASRRARGARTRTREAPRRRHGAPRRRDGAPRRTGGAPCRT